MSNGCGNFEEGDLGAPVTRLQYHALRDTLRREFQVGTSTLEEKQEQLRKETTNSVKDIQIDMNEQLNVLRTNVVADIVCELQSPQDDTSVHHPLLDETGEEADARVTREAQECRARVSAGAIRTPPPRRGRGGDDHGPGRSRGQGGRGGAVHDDDNKYLLHRNDKYHHRNRDGDDRPNKEKFGKLKFYMPKFSSGADSE